jgi:nucleoside-diphosphate-sugar epimerase
MPPPSELRERVEIVYGNITDRLDLLRATEGCESIVHLAALPNPQRGNAETITQVNVVGTQYVLDAAEAHDIKRVALASSCCVFGLVFAKHQIDPQYLPMDEDHPCLPQDLYGLSKIANEDYAAAYTRRTGMTTIALRLTGVMRMTGERHPWYRRQFEHSNRWRSNDLWTYVEERDMARAFRLSIEAPVEGHHRLIIAARDSYTPYDVRDAVREHFPTLTEYCDRVGPHDALYNTSRAEEVLGWVPEHSWREVPELAEIAAKVEQEQAEKAAEPVATQ